MKFKKIKILSIIALSSLSTIALISCSNTSSNTNSESLKPDQENNKTDLSTITSINKNSFKELWYKHPSLFMNNTLNLSFLQNLTHIENDTFMLDNNSLNSNSIISKIIFNDKLEHIGNNAFKNINSLKYLSLPKSIKTIGSHSFDNAFIDDFSRIVFDHEHKLLENIGENSFLNNESLNLFVVNNDLLKTKFESIKESIGYKNTILTDDLNASGKIGNLLVSKYLPIISLLELSNKTRLSSLTNEILNRKIKDNTNIPNNSIYKNTTFEIQDGSSEKLGVLKLKINIPNINLKNGENIIEISGFDKIFEKNLVLSSIAIDPYNYFENLQEEKNIQMWANEDWQKYIKEINVKTIDDLEYFNLAEKNQSSNIDIEFKYSNDRNTHNIYLILKIKNNLYSNNSWIQDSNVTQKIVKGFNLKPISFKLPNNKNDLFNFLRSKMQIDENRKNEIITNMYASKYVSDFRKKIKTWTNSLIKIDSKYDSYLNTLGIKKLIIEATSSYADDINGILSFDYVMKDEQNTSNNYSYISSHSINGFKKINNLFLDSPYIFINRSNDALKKRFIKLINKTKDDLIDLGTNNKTIEMDNFGVLGYGKNVTTDINTRSIILNSWEKGHDTNSLQFSNSSSKYEFASSIFKDKQLNENNIDFSTNLFNNEFIINDIFFSTNMSNKAKLIGVNASTFKYELDIEINISVNKGSINFDNNHQYKLLGKLILLLHPSDYQ